MCACMYACVCVCVRKVGCLVGRTRLMMHVAFIIEGGGTRRAVCKLCTSSQCYSKCSSPATKKSLLVHQCRELRSIHVAEGDG